MGAQREDLQSTVQGTSSFPSLSIVLSMYAPSTLPTPYAREWRHGPAGPVVVAVRQQATHRRTNQAPVGPEALPIRRAADLLQIKGRRSGQPLPCRCALSSAAAFWGPTLASSRNYTKKTTHHWCMIKLSSCPEVSALCSHHTWGARCGPCAPCRYPQGKQCFRVFPQCLELFWGTACARYRKQSHGVAVVLACHFVEAPVDHRAAE